MISPTRHNFLNLKAVPFLAGLFRQQLHCWQAARFARQIELPPYLAVFHGNSRRANLNEALRIKRQLLRLPSLTEHSRDAHRFIR